MDNTNTPDLNTQILISIRDELKGLNGRVDGLNDRVDGLNDRIDGLNDRVDGLNDRVDGLNDRVDGLAEQVREVRSQQVESEIRLATAVLEMRGTLEDVAAHLTRNTALEGRVSKCEEDIAALKESQGSA